MLLDTKDVEWDGQHGACHLESRKIHPQVVVRVCQVQGTGMTLLRAWNRECSISTFVKSTMFETDRRPHVNAACKTVYELYLTVTIWSVYFSHQMVDHTILVPKRVVKMDFELVYCFHFVYLIYPAPYYFKNK